MPGGATSSSKGSPVSRTTSSRRRGAGDGGSSRSASTTRTTSPFPPSMVSPRNRLGPGTRSPSERSGETYAQDPRAVASSSGGVGVVPASTATSTGVVEGGAPGVEAAPPGIVPTRRHPLGPWSTERAGATGGATVSRAGPTSLGGPRTRTSVGRTTTTSSRVPPSSQTPAS